MKVTLAAIQARPVSVEFEDMWSGADVGHAVELLEEAARRGANCACFPELYPRVGEDALCRAAERLGLYVVAGLIEGTRARWYNTGTIIDPGGRVVGRQRKNYPTQGELDAGVVPGRGYQVFETTIGRLGIVICSDYAFFKDGADTLRAGGADIVFNPSWWFALGAAYPATVIGRHMEYGRPVLGVDIAACSLLLRRNGKVVERFPRAGGYTTICVTPPIATLGELAEWFRTKPGGINTTDGFVQTLGEDEGILYAEVDLDAVRRFPGYFYRAVEPARP
ncbi:MAG: carbon-nitrogen hydrolase family protein [Armatimonadota bacterium]|nr:carbon-nitrogen hydrolase family protein [Armatimonadota bacterium]